MESVNMKNEYEVRGNVTAIFVKCKGETLECLIDTNDLERAKQFPMAWCGVWKESVKTHYVRGDLPIGNKKRKKVYLHSWLCEPEEGKIVDHLNHNGLDNKRSSNLRMVTNAENMQNRKGATRASKSGIRGVHWNKKDKRWRAVVYLNGKGIHVGSFTDIKEAEKAVKKARAELHKFSKEALVN